jgi:hypothetical protein
LPEGPEILDFFHATEHLAAAIAAIHGDGTFATRHKLEFLRERLLTEDIGVDAVIDALIYLRRKHPRLTKAASVLAYFRRNRRRTRYAQWKREGYMIGSGVVEAACKTLVTQRLKLCGMRGEPPGHRPFSRCEAGIRVSASTKRGHSSPPLTSATSMSSPTSSTSRPSRKRNADRERHDENYTLTSGPAGADACVSARAVGVPSQIQTKRLCVRRSPQDGVPRRRLALFAVLLVTLAVSCQSLGRDSTSGVGRVRVCTGIYLRLGATRRRAGARGREARRDARRRRGGARQ